MTDECNGMKWGNATLNQISRVLMNVRVLYNYIVN